MKAKKLVFGLLMTLVLISSSVVLAQEDGPPTVEQQVDPPPFSTSIEREQIPPTQGPIPDPEPDPEGSIVTTEPLPFMQTRPYPVSETLAVDTSGMLDETDLEAGALIEPQIPEDHGEMLMPEKMEAIPDAYGREVEDETGILVIANVTYDEYQADVAHGGNHYMVVYKDQDDIRAKVYTHTGSLYQNFLIKDCSPHFCKFPSIDYEANSSLFLVAFEWYDGVDYEIYHQAVSPTTGVIGSPVYTSTATNEWYPSVACNPVDGSCLIAHEDATNNQIEGAWMELSSSGISAYHPFIIALEDTTDDVSRPCLAWGQMTGRYMLTYARDFDSSYWHPFYQHLYDVLVTPPQYSHGTAAVVPITFGSEDKYPTGVTYDPCIQKFVIVFTHEYTTTVFDVWISLKHPTEPVGYGHDSVAYRWAKEHLADISFVTDKHLTPACGRMDKLLVIYKYEDSGQLLATDLRGNNDILSPYYEIDSEYKHMVVASDITTPIFEIGNPAISSSSKKAHMFAVFDANYPSNGLNNVYGRILKIPDKIYLPLLNR